MDFSMPVGFHEGASAEQMQAMPGKRNALEEGEITVMSFVKGQDACLRALSRVHVGIISTKAVMRRNAIS
jgi:ribosomal protein S11